MSLKNTLLPIQYTLQSHGRLLSLASPVVMGILNVTPDSFFTKGRNSDADGLLATAEKMLHEGATILDIGGASTRPGSGIIDTEEELKRVIPVVEAIHKRFPEAWLSADTYHAKVAEEAVHAGVSIINDISSGSIDGNMIQTVARLKVPYIAMHMQGTPETMQQNPQYTDVAGEVRNYLAGICKRCTDAGIADVIIDPGFGFGKTVAHNFALLRELHTFRITGRPLLAGISRKSMICRTLNVSPEQALNGTTALHMEALRQGANMLRVHDVKEAMEVIKLYTQSTMA
ncbi:dihydropteroate synthase [Chitinophagaceae bacterium MMS25-I14]